MQAHLHDNLKVALRNKLQAPLHSNLQDTSWNDTQNELHDDMRDTHYGSIFLNGLLVNMWLSLHRCMQDDMQRSL